jgi:hypothetical protein
MNITLQLQPNMYHMIEPRVTLDMQGEPQVEYHILLSWVEWIKISKLHHF